MTEIPTFTDEQIDHHLIYLDALVATKKALKESVSAQRMANIAAIIRQLRGHPVTPTTPEEGAAKYYVVDLHARVIIPYDKQTDVARIYRVNQSAVSDSVSGERAFQSGRYRVSRDLSQAEDILQSTPALAGTRRITYVEVISPEGTLLERYCSVHEFADAYDLHVSSAYSLIRRVSSASTGAIPGCFDKKFRVIYRS